MVTDAFLTMLRAAVTALGATAITIGDHEAPDPPTLPYAILYAIPGGVSSGPPLSDEAFADAEQVYQLTCVNIERDGADFVADTLRAAVFGRTSGRFTRAISPTGMAVTDRRDRGSSPTVLYGNLWQRVEKLSLLVTPA